MVCLLQQCKQERARNRVRIVALKDVQHQLLHQLKVLQEARASLAPEYEDIRKKSQHSAGLVQVLRLQVCGEKQQREMLLTEQARLAEEVVMRLQEAEALFETSKHERTATHSFCQVKRTQFRAAYGNADSDLRRLACDISVLEQECPCLRS